MPSSISAKKRVRQNAKRRGHNRWRKDQLKTVLKVLDQAIASGDKAKAGELYRQASSKLDKTAAQGTIHRNLASRKKSRLAARLQKMQ